MTALGARRAVTEPATLADVLTNALARPNVSPLVRDGVLVLAGSVHQNVINGVIVLTRQ